MSEPRPFTVELVPPDPAWVARAAFETDRLHAALGDALLEVHHIGSTAIPGIVAKPIVDLMPVVRDLTSFDERVSGVTSLGYQSWGDAGIDGRRYCTFDNPQTLRREVQLHVFASGSPHIERHLAFRDYMRSCPDEAIAYQLEKLRCRDLHPADSHAYSAAKSDWVRAAEQRSLAWARVRIR